MILQRISEEIRKNKVKLILEQKDKNRTSYQLEIGPHEVTIFEEKIDVFDENNKKIYTYGSLKGQCDCMDFVTSKRQKLMNPKYISLSPCKHISHAIWWLIGKEIVKGEKNADYKKIKDTKKQD
jgi:hypothetical protein